MHPLITPRPPPPRGRLQAAFIPPLPSRLLAFPPLSPSTRGSCRRRRTLCCGAAGAAAAAAVPGGLAARPGRAAGPRAPLLSRCWAPGLTRPAPHPPAACRRPGSQPLGGGTAGGWGGSSLSPAPLSLPPSLPASLQPHHVGVRILHPPCPDFPLPLFRERERWREATRLQRRGPPNRPACKVLL